MILGISGKINSGKDTVGSIIQYLYYEHSDIDIDNKLSYEEFVKTDRTNNILVSNVVPEIKKYADKLKDIVCIILSCTREQLEDRVFKETELGKEWWYVKLGNTEKYKLITVQEYKEYIKGTTYIFNESDIIKPTPRLLLQLIGTECGRQIIHPNIWINATMIDYDITNLYELQSHVESEPKYPNWIITDVRFPNEADAITKHGGINIRIQKSNMFDAAIKSLALEHESETALDLYKFDYIVNHGTIEALIEQVREILIKENII